MNQKIKWNQKILNIMKQISLSIQHTPLPLLSEKESSASQELTSPRSPPGRPITISFSFTSVITPQSFIPGETFCKKLQKKTETP